GVSVRKIATNSGVTALTIATMPGVSGAINVNSAATISKRTATNAGTNSKAGAKIARNGVINAAKTGNSIARTFGNIAPIVAKKSGTTPRTFTMTALMMPGGVTGVGAVTGLTIRSTHGGGGARRPGRQSRVMPISRRNRSTTITE